MAFGLRLSRGLMGAGFLAIFAVIVAAVYSNQMRQQIAKDPNHKPPISVMAAWGFAVAIAGGALLVIPRLMAYLQGQKWKGLQVQIDSLIGQGSRT